MRGKAVHPLFRPEGQHNSHVSPTPLKFNPEIDLFVGMDFGLCYSDDTEVLTDTGWKLFADVDERVDRVATLNPDGFGLEWVLPNFKIARPYQGDMIEFKGQNFDFCVTPEHITPFTHRDTPDKIRFASAEGLAGATTAHRYIQLAARRIDGVPMNMFGLSDETFARFMGWWLSEGCVARPPGRGNRVSITQIKPAPDLDAMIASDEWAEIGITWGRDRANWRASFPPAFADYLRQFGKAHDKFVPLEIKRADPRIVRLFVDAYIAGDGHVRTKVKKDNGTGRRARFERALATVSRRMADDMQELALLLGGASTIRRQKAQTSTMRCGRKICSDGVWIVSFKDITRAEILPHHVRRVAYDGMIYCLNVPHHTLYVRRNGRPCWNGNTPAVVFGQTIRGRVFVLGELYAEDVGAVSFAPIVKREILRRFPDIDIARVKFIGDPGSNIRSQADEKTPYDIFRQNGMPVYPAPGANRFSSVGGRKEVVDNLLERQVDGYQALLIDPTARMLIQGLAGGYQFKVTRTSHGEFTSGDVVKNSYSHTADAFQYLLLGMGEGGNLLFGAGRNTATVQTKVEVKVFDRGRRANVFRARR
jgi:hypothetical protein